MDNNYYNFLGSKSEIQKKKWVFFYSINDFLYLYLIIFTMKKVQLLSLEMLFQGFLIKFICFQEI